MKPDFVYRKGTRAATLKRKPYKAYTLQDLIAFVHEATDMNDGVAPPGTHIPFVGSIALQLGLSYKQVTQEAGVLYIERRRKPVDPKVEAARARDLELFEQEKQREPKQDRKARQTIRSPWGKLDHAKAEEIRQAYAQGDMTYAKLAEQYGVTRETIRLVVANKIWKP